VAPARALRRAAPLEAAPPAGGALRLDLVFCVLTACHWPSRFTKKSMLRDIGAPACHERALPHTIVARRVADDVDVGRARADSTLYARS